MCHCVNLFACVCVCVCVEGIILTGAGKSTYLCRDHCWVGCHERPPFTLYCIMEQFCGLPPGGGHGVPSPPSDISTRKLLVPTAATLLNQACWPSYDLCTVMGAENDALTTGDPLCTALETLLHASKLYRGHHIVLYQNCTIHTNVSSHTALIQL